MRLRGVDRGWNALHTAALARRNGRHRGYEVVVLVRPAPVVDPRQLGCRSLRRAPRPGPLPFLPRFRSRPRSTRRSMPARSNGSFSSCLWSITFSSRGRRAPGSHSRGRMSCATPWDVIRLVCLGHLCGEVECAAMDAPSEGADAIDAGHGLAAALGVRVRKVREEGEDKDAEDRRRDDHGDTQAVAGAGCLCISDAATGNLNAERATHSITRSQVRTVH